MWRTFWTSSIRIISSSLNEFVVRHISCKRKEYLIKIRTLSSSVPLNTFLNAMTYSDKTIYPVASCNEKDFQNLMHVYLDAVFYPRREVLFIQENQLFRHIHVGLMYGLQILDSWLYADDAPFIHVEANDTYARLREKAEQGYFEKLVQTYLIDNPHKSLSAPWDTCRNPPPDI